MGVKKERGLTPFLFFIQKFWRRGYSQGAPQHSIITYSIKIVKEKNEKILHKKDPEIRSKCIIKKFKKVLTKTSYRCIISLTVKENNRKEVKHEKGYNDSSL